MPMLREYQGIGALRDQVNGPGSGHLARVRQGPGEVENEVVTTRSPVTGPRHSKANQVWADDLPGSEE